MTKSNYILQKAHKSHCPYCARKSEDVELLCTDEQMIKALRVKHWFYICWGCKRVFELGKGEVKREEGSYKRT